MPTDLSCHDLLTFMGEYVAGRLESRVHLAFEAHLAICPECVAYLNDFGAILRLAQSCSVAPDQLPAEVPRQLIRAVQGSRAR